MLFFVRVASDPNDEYTVTIQLYGDYADATLGNKTALSFDAILDYVNVKSVYTFTLSSTLLTNNRLNLVLAMKHPFFFKLYPIFVIAAMWVSDAGCETSLGKEIEGKGR